MIHLTVLDALRAAAPDTLTAGHIRSRIIDNYPHGSTEPDRANILEALKQLRQTGLVDEVTGVGTGPSEWRAK